MLLRIKEVVLKGTQPVTEKRKFINEPVNKEYSSISSDDFIALLDAVGLPRGKTTAKFFGADYRNARRWADGSSTVPIPVVMVLELMKHFDLSPDETLKITGFD